MPTYDVFDSIQEIFELEDYITTRPVLTYTIYSKILHIKYTRRINYDDGMKAEELKEQDIDSDENQYVEP